MPCSATINLSDNGAICKAPCKCNYTLLMMINILLSGKQPEEEENIRGREKKKPQVFFSSSFWWHWLGAILFRFLAQCADTVTQTGVTSELGRKCVDLSRKSVWQRAGRKQDSVVVVEAI